MKPPRIGYSHIEYLDRIWTFYSGCKNTIDICAVNPYCWARGTVKRFPWHYPNGFEPTFYPEAYLSPLYLKKPCRIGVAFMGDLFGDWVNPEMEVGTLDSLGKVFARTTLKNLIFTVIKSTPHTYIFLTKCGWNLQKWSPFPDNCHVGIGGTGILDFSAAVQYLSHIEAKVKFISQEPLYNWDARITKPILEYAKEAGINWLIIGAQTNPYRLPLLSWVEEIVRVATVLEIPVFLKDNLLGFLPDKDLFFIDTGRTRHLRQELP